MLEKKCTLMAFISERQRERERGSVREGFSVPSQQIDSASQVLILYLCNYVISFRGSIMKHL